MRPALPVSAGTGVLTEALHDSLRFFAYPDSAPALRDLPEAGLRTVVVSNWDHSLRETRLAPLLDGALASAEVGAAKPDPAIFAAALELAGTRDAWHFCDTVDADVRDALDAGLRPVLISRHGGSAAPLGVPMIESL